MIGATPRPVPEDQQQQVRPVPDRRRPIRIRVSALQQQVGAGAIRTLLRSEEHVIDVPAGRDRPRHRLQLDDRRRAAAYRRGGAQHRTHDHEVDAEVEEERAGATGPSTGTSTFR